MVNHGSTHPTPEPILKLQRQLEDFRSSQPVRTKLPESLWQTAVELARQYGIYPVAHPLRLDYMGLKKRLGDLSPPHRRKAAPPSSLKWWRHNRRRWRRALLSSSPHAGPRCAFIGKPPHRLIGRTCCMP